MRGIGANTLRRGWGCAPHETGMPDPPRGLGNIAVSAERSAAVVQPTLWHLPTLAPWRQPSRISQRRHPIDCHVAPD